MTFTAKHEEQLHALFGDEFKGRMGARSSMGHMLDHAQAMAVHAADRSGDYMPVAGPSRDAHRGSVEISEDAMRAAREERHIRSALQRVAHGHVRVLRLAYTPQPRGATPALVVALLGTERVAQLQAETNDASPEVRRLARRALAGARRWADQVLAEARAAYAEAEAVEARGGAARAFARTMGVT